MDACHTVLRCFPREPHHKVTYASGSSFSTNFLETILTLSKNSVQIYKTIILPVVLYGCGTWPPTLKEEHRLRVFENRVFKRILGPRREKVIDGWKNCLMRSILTSASCQILSDDQNEQDEMGGTCGTTGNKKCV
jgi:hypothetical protein